MSERAQPVRPTQFVTTYGPGAILETLGGPKVIYSIADSGLFDEQSPKDYEIKEPALSAILPQGGRVFRLPTNAERDVEDARSIYNTLSFPNWSLCTHHGILYRREIDKGKACPKCPKMPKWQAWEQANLQTVSFVMACQAGHLDDVSWVSLVHQGSSCKPSYLEWRGSGGPLRGVVIACPLCGASARLSDLYHRDHKCFGRFAERKDSRNGSCDRPARLTQRGASDIFLPTVYTALTLPVIDSEVHRALRHDAVRIVLEMKLDVKSILVEDDWVEITGGRRVPTSIRETILSVDLAQRNSAAATVCQESEHQSPETARVAEHAMLKAASRGQVAATRHFEVDHVGARRFALGRYSLRVTPVTRLRLVAAQVGYTRLSGELVDTAYSFLGDSWYPGVELFGEGLFLELESPIELAGPAARSWTERFELSGSAHDHPVTVWWHTFSHRLIRALAVDSGYSAAAVRERLYYDGKSGGLLLYAVQPGGDGTLGGLIALVPRFDRLLAWALRQLDGCSNDPLCSEQVVTSERGNGAACYACSLLSETSCEMRNLSLDRNLLVETL